LTLQVALSDGTLTAFLLDPGSSEMFRLTSTDWHGSVFWWQTIVGGRIRASVEADISRHAGQRVFVEDSAFGKWLMGRRRNVAASNDCLTWLTGEMRANPGERPQPKAWYLAEARAKFGAVSKREFERLWGDAKRTSGANWQAGRRSKQSPQ
jgi:hypothetical protein